MGWTVTDQFPHQVIFLDYQPPHARPGAKVLEVFNWIYDNLDHKTWRLVEEDESYDIVIGMAIVSKNRVKFVFSFQNPQDAIYVKLLWA